MLPAGDTTDQGCRDRAAMPARRTATAHLQSAIVIGKKEPGLSIPSVDGCTSKNPCYDC